MLKHHLNSVLFFICAILLAYSNSSAQKLPSNFSGFVENKGQIIDQNNNQNKDVLFLFSGKGIKIQLRKTGYSYELFSLDGAPINLNSKLQNPYDLLRTKININRLDIDFVGMNEATEVVSEIKNEDCFNYFISGQEITNVNSFNKITYKNVFPKTDIEFIINQQNDSPFKYNIVLNPGADIENVKFLVKGASAIIIENGDIALLTPAGIINETIPHSYYSISPDKNEVVNFVVKNNLVSFSAKYNKSEKFVIDPSTNRIWGTYYGGPSLDYCTATDIDNQNNVYITGYTLSATNIATSGVYQSTIGGSFDIYLAKFNSSGARIWATYFGSSSVEAAYAMCVSATGNIYLCGDTFSTSGVATVGAHQTVYGGGVDDALLVKFDSTGQLSWATYCGGLFHDIASGVVEDKDGNVIITGHSESATGIATIGSYNNSYAGGYDVFVVKFDSTGVRQWGTYYGDFDIDEAYAIDCDISNNIYVGGFTTSSSSIATASGHQTGYSSQQDGFVAKFNPSGTTLMYGTYYGGLGNDQVTSLKLDPGGNIFIVGNTTSNTNIASAGAYQSTIGSADDGFVARFNSLGVRQWGTYFGGNDVDYIADLVFDTNENLLFCGSTLSTNIISTNDAYQSNLAVINLYDSYFERFDKSGIREHGTYFGGSSNDHGRGITMDDLGKVYIAGETSSVDSIASAGAFNTVWAGGDDAFLAKFCIAPEPTIFPSGTITICYGDTLWLSTQAGFASYFWNDSTSINPLITNDSSVTGTYYYFVTVTDGTGCDATTDSSVVIVDLCAGLNENIENESLRLFPVPSSDVLFCNFNYSHKKENIQIEIYSSKGELVYKNTTFESDNYIDIKKLSQGIYILQVRVDEKIFQKKFIKK